MLETILEVSKDDLPNDESLGQDLEQHSITKANGNQVMMEQASSGFKAIDNNFMEDEHVNMCLLSGGYSYGGTPASQLNKRPISSQHCFNNSVMQHK